MNNFYKKKSKISISFPGSIQSELDLNNINDTKRKLEEIIQKKGGKNVRDLIDKYFSISWCENNLVVPVSSTFDKSLDVEIIKIAVADFSYIDSLSEDIKKQLNKKKARCEVKELEIKEINKILALAKNESSLNKEIISDFDLNKDLSTKESLEDTNSDIDELIDIGNLDFESPDDFELQEEIEFYNDNEDTIYVDSYDIKNNQDLVIKALKIYFADNLPEYNLTLIKNDIFKIGKLTIKIIISNPLTDFIFLSKSNMIDNLFSSKIFLLAEVNDEVRSVYFKGLITNKELLDIYNESICDYENNLKINKVYFKGGIERFYSLINVKKTPFIKQNSKLIKKFLSTKFYLSLRKLIPKKVSNELLIESFEKISFLLKNGSPLGDTIYSTSESTNNKELKKIYENVYHSLMLGKNLNESLYPFKNIIDISIIEMLEIGEQTGTLSNVFKVCAEKLKKNVIIENQSKFTISNKWFLLFIFVLCFAYFFAPDISTQWKYFNNGTFHPLYESLRILENYVGFYFYPLIILLSFIFFKLTSIYKLFTPKNLRKKIDYRLIRLPIISDIILKFSLSNFTRNLSIFTESGLPLVDSLNSSENEEDNISIKRIIRNMSYKISKGYSFSEILEEENIFPKFFKDSLRLGEETGCLSYILEQLADFYDSELYYSLNKWQQNFQRFFDFILISLSVIILSQLVQFIFVYRWLF